MTDETSEIMNKANETLAQNFRDRADLTWRVSSGNVSKEEALAILDKQEKRDRELIAEIDQKIAKLEGELERAPQGDQGDAGRPLGGRGNWTIWLVLIPLAIFGSFAAWVIISSLR